jgi:hypothetical protein
LKKKNIPKELIANGFSKFIVCNDAGVLRKNIAVGHPTWQNTTQDERKDLVHVMIQEVGVDLTAKSMLWVKARPDYEPLFSILDGLRLDNEKRYWIERREVEGNNCDITEDAGQMDTGVEILLQAGYDQLPSSLRKNGRGQP